MKRYDLEDHSRGMDCWRTMEEASDGEYVKHEDSIAEIKRMRETLEFIRDNGGSTTKEGVSCNGSWCSEQARRTLEQSTALAGKEIL